MNATLLQRKRIVWIVVSCVFVSSICVSFHIARGDAPTPAGGRSKPTEHLWNDIANIQARKTDGYKTNPDDYWIEIIHFARRIFDKTYDSADDQSRRDMIRYYVEQFGKHGPEADIRWMAACPFPLLADIHDNEALESARDRQLNSYICEAETRYFLKDQKIFRRYYRLLIWSQSYLCPKSAGMVVELVTGFVDRRIRNKGSLVYWLRVRDCMLLFHATGRDDLIDEKFLEKLPERFEEWKKWYRENRPYFRTREDGIGWYLDPVAKKERKPFRQPFKDEDFEILLPLLKRPSLPFDDWNPKGPPPPPAKLVRTAESW